MIGLAEPQVHAGVQPKSAEPCRCMRNNWSFIYTTSFEIACSTSSTTILYILTSFPAVLRDVPTPPQCYPPSSVFSPMYNHFKILLQGKKISNIFNLPFSTCYLPTTCNCANLNHTKPNLPHCDRKNFEIISMTHAVYNLLPSESGRNL